MKAACPDSEELADSSIAARVHRELHERPPLDVQLPAHIHHSAYLLPEQEGSRKKARADMVELFLALGINSDQANLGERHSVGEKTYSNGDKLRITWELHSEFVTMPLPIWLQVRSHWVLVP